MTWNLLTVAFGGDKYIQGQNFLNKQAAYLKKFGLAYTYHHQKKQLINSKS